MYAIETAKMSSKGQLVVPEAFRKRYGWQAGTTLLMLGASGGVLLQTLPVPSEREVERTLAETQVAAATAMLAVQVIPTRQITQAQSRRQTLTATGALSRTRAALKSVSLTLNP